MNAIELKELLGMAEWQYNHYIIDKSKDEPIKIKLFSGLKPGGYYVPNVMAYKGGRERKMRWYCEIWYNGLCVYREDSQIIYGEDMKTTEQNTINKIIGSVFNHSIHSQYKLIKGMHENKLH